MSVNNNASGPAVSGVRNMSEISSSVMTNTSGTAAPSVSSGNNVAAPSVSSGNNVAAPSVASGNNVAAPNVQAHNNQGFVVVPYQGPDGTTYTEDTPPSDFADWAAYTTFCQSGPQLRVLCASGRDNNGNVVSYHETFVSKKLMSDFGGYFKAMFRSNMREAANNTVQYEDIAVEDFTRLCMCISAGGPATRNIIGKPEEIMTNLLTVYTLADRFQMLSVREWLRDSILDCVNTNRTWMSLYHHQVIDHPPVADAEEFHKAKVHDHINFYLTMKDLPLEIHPISTCDFLAFMADHCPGTLLEDMWDEIDYEFQQDFGRALLRQTLQRI